MSWLIILCIIIINSMFVIMEVALLTSRHVKLEWLAQHGSKGASKALQLIRTPEKFLSIVQIGITFMSIILGLYGGATVGDSLVEWLDHLPYLQQYSHAISNAIMVIFITYLTVLGEIIPKRIAMMYPEKFSSFFSHIMWAFMKVFRPFIALLTLSTKLVMTMLRVKEVRHELTVEELKLFINQAEHSGTVEKTERDMIRRLVHLSDMSVGTVMTPRNKIVYLNAQDSDAENLRKLYTYPFNSFPVIDGDVNKIIGTISVKELFRVTFQGKPLALRNKVKPVIYIPEMVRLTKLIELLKSKQSRMAIVTDEYGDIEGIVTLNDIVKTFVGDLATLIEGQKPNIIERQDGYWVSGKIPVEEIMEVLNLQSLPGENEEDYRTLASFILKQLNKVPKEGDYFIASGWKFKVVRMDNLRIDRVLIQPVLQKEED